jgi:hypothetical protein
MCLMLCSPVAARVTGSSMSCIAFGIMEGLHPGGWACRKVVDMTSVAVG